MADELLFTRIGKRGRPPAATTDVLSPSRQLVINTNERFGGSTSELATTYGLHSLEFERRNRLIR